MEEKKKRILIVEDEKNIAYTLAYNIMQAGYSCDIASDGEEGLNKALTDTYDLILLDLMLPKMDGFTVCKNVRQKLSTPIIILTARVEEVDKIMGLDTGADDYVTKPFSVNELLSRIKANIRRSRGEVVSTGSEAKQEIIEIRGLKIDTSHYSVEIDGKAIDDITKKDYEILLLLAKNPGKVFTFEEICSKIWGYDFCGEDEKQTVTTAVHRLRAKLESNSQEPEYVHNKRGVGYYLK
ncbi:MAG: response regulator transcription factor [Ruminococcaceae bacterium]|nr:response regulator transcription factor [Oscillospiraceae bacterium]